MFFCVVNFAMKLRSNSSAQATNDNAVAPFNRKTHIYNSLFKLFMCMYDNLFSDHQNQTAQCALFRVCPIAMARCRSQMNTYVNVSNVQTDLSHSLKSYNQNEKQVIMKHNRQKQNITNKNRLHTN